MSPVSAVNLVTRRVPIDLGASKWVVFERIWSGFSIGGSRGLHWRGHDPLGSEFQHGWLSSNAKNSQVDLVR